MSASRPPGETLRHELEQRNLTQGEFAAILGRPIQAINEILSGKKAITPEMAHLIATALGDSPDYWMELETRYRLSLARNNDDIQDVERRARLFHRAPIQELVRRGWLPKTRDLDLLESRLCEFLELRSIDERPQWASHLRRSFAFEASPGALDAWLAIARRQALEQAGNMAAFDKARLIEEAPKLVQLSLKLRISPVFERLRQLGVRTTHVPHLPRTYVDGATTWLGHELPVIIFSFRYRRIDNFWFTLMHELAHVILHDGQSFVDDRLVDGQPEPRSPQENQADAAASDWLIDPKVFNEWASGKSLFSASEIERFAKTLRIHPGLVVGRLHHLGTLAYTHLRRYLPPVEIEGTS